MKINTWLLTATKKLSSADIPSARLDSLILLEDILGKSRSWLLAHPEDVIIKKDLKILDDLIERRRKHEPLAYIRGKAEFYGREFKVTPETLQPRPETETMLELFEKLPVETPLAIADVGTGSGAIAISVKLARPDVNVFATEINEAALSVAQQNARDLGAEIAFFKGNLLEPLSNRELDVILANLPYVPDEHTINQAAMQEPKIAIFGGSDGLDLYREMFQQINELSHKPNYMLTESLPFQHETLAQIAQDSGYSLIESEDFIQVFKFG